MTQKILNGILLDEQTELSLHDLCVACSSSEQWIIELVEEGALEPVNLHTTSYQQTEWRFSADSLQKVHTAMRLQRDLSINLAGVALALDLLEEIEALETRLKCLK
ncbi:MAG: chaperone modulator CbpM [Gammaproteobacteria bacterium]|nr:chaperone modulator CbpM [Gammaproteobacteria bacterium]